ncbi:MAG: RNA-binding S4 domain-containing protein [Saprospiraceae bacterium]|uniref:RNA-binding S4 domain-containing protein n=1 Tax=Candidatus Opimibacter skivensis TaxID=2982028 RepID=A0A9D7SRH7_9BACT|nr:RNA-binding S4 domain-containing protein [Candidatus Opimibacter skivensis]
METFELQGHEYIELNKLLKRKNLVETGGEANICIENGEVMVNEVVETRKRNKLRDGFVVEFREQKILIKA